MVYFEPHETAEGAQRREWLMKRWRRDWKIALIEKNNPTWRDLNPDAERPTPNALMGSSREEMLMRKSATW